jgi:hypothetical protein
MIGLDNDQSDNPFGAEADRTNDLRDLIGEQLRQSAESDADDEPDTGGFDAPMGEPEDRDLMPAHEAAEEANESKVKPPAAKRKKATGSDDAQVDEGAAKAEPPATDEAKADGADKDADDLTKADLPDLVRDLPEARGAEIVRRLNAAEIALAPFRTDYVKAQMAAHGATPEAVSARLVELATFAAEKPAEYVAWVLKEASKDREGMQEMLGQAAKTLGLQLVPASADDDDEFTDPVVKELREENARLKAQMQGGEQWGPDAPERRAQLQAQQALTAFIHERDGYGNLKRPHFAQVQPRIAQMAQAHRAQNPQSPVTVAHIQGFYDLAVQEAQQMFAPAPGNSAPQAAPDVAKQFADEKAAAAARARRAASPIDGTGHGAPRQPAIDAENLSLEQLIRQVAAQQSAQ